MQKGQAVLIVLLTSVVALTVVLSVISSASSDVKISTNEVSSQRAFSAAESGVQRALVTNANTSGNVNSGAQFNATVSNLAEGQKSFIYPANLVNGDNAIFWFVAHSQNGNLNCSSNNCFTGQTVNLCWGKPGTASGTATTPAISFSLSYLTTPGSYSTAAIAKGAYDPNSSRLSVNAFSTSDAGTCAINGTQFAFQKQISLSAFGVPSGAYTIQNGLQFLSVKMLYNTDLSQPLGIDLNYAGNSVLPSQGTLVSSTGNLNDTTRKVQVTRAYGGLLSVLDNAIYSEGGLAQ